MTRVRLHLLPSLSLLHIEKTLRIADLLSLRNLSAAHARAEGLDIHGRQSSRRGGLRLRFDVEGVQAMRSREPDPAVSHDG